MTNTIMASDLGGCKHTTKAHAANERWMCVSVIVVLLCKPSASNINQAFAVVNCKKFHVELYV